VLSGTGSTREYVQRLGRVLRKGNDASKLALLYEVIAEETTEEGTARRRQPKPTPQTHQRTLALVPSPVKKEPKPLPRAAETPADWNAEPEE
jgi:superfamily II DNA or RNA helicase